MSGFPQISRLYGAEPDYSNARVRDLRASENASDPVAIIEVMPLDQIPDEELVVKHRSAESAADRDQYINELFRRHYARVGRWCLRFTNDRESAADLAQEVFAKAYQNLHSFQMQSKFSTWLFVIARNQCLNSLRANSRQATELKAEVEEDFIADIPDRSHGPYDAAERASSARVVNKLLAEALDETERTVFTLHYGEDLPLDEITRLLGLENRSGAKAFIVSAKRKLARLTQQWKASGQYNAL
jgi:RNA polymerase sigma-70 factor (ECF subfamily)